MATFLLTWNPRKWHWDDLAAEAQRCQTEGSLEGRWGCGRNSSIQPGDRLFLLRQGQEPRGLMAAGHALSPVFEEEHWGTDGSIRQPLARYVELRWETLLNPEQEPIFLREWLNSPAYAGVHWNTMISGIRIPPEPASALEAEWAAFLASRSSAR